MSYERLKGRSQVSTRGQDGAQSLFDLPSLITSRSALRSAHVLATGLQKCNGRPAQSSMIRSRWCGVMVHPTVSPHFFTASTAAAVVACSSTIRSLGKRACRE